MQNGRSFNKEEKSCWDLYTMFSPHKEIFVNMYRDLGYYWLRFMIYITLCLCLGTIFHNAGNSYDSIQARGTMSMFAVSFLTFMAIGGFPSFVDDVKIFGRERLNGHYGVLAFVFYKNLSTCIKDVVWKSEEDMQEQDPE